MPQHNQVNKTSTLRNCELNPKPATSNVCDPAILRPYDLEVGGKGGIHGSHKFGNELRFCSRQLHAHKTFPFACWIRAVVGVEGNTMLRSVINLVQIESRR
ncbi:uncharacterized protein LAJ45_03553 [Morchella importuna]|uniref:uncharacterized protein n=1 Tax=Morchella importuna TaxID=1174673 RepID=UPI001E8EBCD7|nr:uncharacterized protein LAJ45_03553 [Morchella importuna]KAH8152127.1 hypothetical protein LAJ45_03553 [Morchella importuna]